MKVELEKLCSDYLANRETVSKVFRWDNTAIHSACANIFCACGRTADESSLKECRKVIKKHTRPFSKFRGKLRPVLSSMLAISDNPEARMDLANEYFNLLKRKFKKTEYLVLAAFLLTDLTEKSLTEETAARGKEIYRRMNKQHRLLTNNTDSVFAMLMAFSEKTDDELVSDVETCYSFLKKQFSSSSAVQTSAQVLSSASGSPEENAQRMIDLYNALHEVDVKYGHSSELAPLAALSLADTPVTGLVEEITSVDAFLGSQKGYGTGGISREDRAMHAVMIVSDQYAGTRQVNVTVMTNTLDMLISKQQASRVSFFFHLLQFAAQILSGSREKAADEGKADKDTGTDNGADTDKQP